MIRYLFLLTLVFFFDSSFAQQAPENTLKKLTATIDKEYTNFQDPITINYTIYPYGGSGNYEFRWRVKGETYNLFSNVTNYSLSFSCSENERPECTVFCEVRDTTTGETFKTELIHAIEICINNN